VIFIFDLSDDRSTAVGMQGPMEFIGIFWERLKAEGT
jgi:hypothetical protein